MDVWSLDFKFQTPFLILIFFFEVSNLITIGHRDNTVM